MITLTVLQFQQTNISTIQWNIHVYKKTYTTICSIKITTHPDKSCYIYA